LQWRFHGAERECHREKVRKGKSIETPRCRWIEAVSLRESPAPLMHSIVLKDGHPFPPDLIGAGPLPHPALIL
jgi:hypothetical protein